MSLLSFLKEYEDTRKIFGERELKIIEKQLNGVSLSQSEKNRLSRDIRRKFEFIRQAARFDGQFRLKKSSEIRSRIDEAISGILEDFLAKDILSIILYGSAADNTLTLRSDVDIAVKFKDIDLRQATLFRKRMAGRLPEKIDIQVYNHLPKKIRDEIDKKGKVIYENKRQD